MLGSVTNVHVLIYFFEHIFADYSKNEPLILKPVFDITKQILNENDSLFFFSLSFKVGLEAFQINFTQLSQWSRRV